MGAGETLIETALVFTYPRATESNAQANKRAYVTAKQRRDMKKGKLPKSTDAENGEEVDDGDEPAPAPKEVEKKVPKAKGMPAPAPVPRGKKGKLKKIKEKYADQDDEERQLRMEILKVG